MTTFFLIRHASTDALGKYLSGRMAGVSLNEQGRREAEELAHRLRLLPLASVYSSPLERALQTAVPLAHATNLDVQEDPAFNELHFGDWTGTAFGDLAGNEGFLRFNTFRSNYRIPGGETMAEAQLRFVAGMERLAVLHPGQTIAIVSHSDMIKAALAHYAGIHLDLMQRLEISPASVSGVTVFSETARVFLLNHTGEVAVR